ncbi:MAG TPA: D-amino acid dehydrogenase [Usitatibacteraceae bacterium]|nr:D-amino acid dehydrogenase [Usitatibacteraceae bacterium]
MKVIVLGAGVIGTASAWYLAQAGHDVEVVERRAGPGLETSFANGGQVSVCHAEPWANPGAPLKILKWLMREDAPLLFRLRMDPAQWSWGLAFLHECLAWRTRRNIPQILAMAFHGRDMLQRLRAETGIEYEQSTRGILHFYTDRAEYAAACEAAALMRRYGLDRTVKSVDEAIAIEPALAGAAARIVGATYTPSDESGDAYLFTVNLAKLAEAKGVRFRTGCAIRGLRATGKGVTGVMVSGAAGEEAIVGDAYVVALGAYSPLLTRPLGIDLPVYPAKGYSATMTVADPGKAPRVSLTDDEAKIVISRLGERLRIAGTAEISGWSTDLDPVRCEALVKRTRSIFPDACDWERPEYWAGLRPSTPSNVPLVGATRIPNLWLNTGHGTLGWTMACGSGAALAELMSGRRPGIDFEFTRP